MKPSRVLLFGIIVFSVSILIQLIHPRNGIQLSDKLGLYFPTVQDVFVPDNRSDQERLLSIIKEDILSDSINGEQRKLDSLRLLRARDSIRNYQLSIHYPNNDKRILYSFFNALDKVGAGKKPIHVVHYGDSQIEGDRITAYIRHKLQEQFGGNGPGWLPVQPLAYPRSIILKHSDNWKSYYFYNRGDSLINHRMYGHMGIFSRFTAYPDSTLQDSTLHYAWVSYKATSRSYAGTRSFKDVRIFYGKNTKPVTIELVHKDSVVFTKVLEPTTSPEVVRYRFPNYINEITIRFTGNDSPDVYGISLDDTQGVMVDNIGMRGDSGANFTTLEKDSYEVAFSEFNIPLFILQFGGNAVPYAITEGRIKGYARNFKRNIQYLKQLVPNAAVIVIGPSDMSVLEGTNWVTYPTLEQVRDALKDAAFEAGACYWDLYEAMGGNGSMKEWVNANPPLAIKDYAHFTDKGALKVSQWFTEALFKEYQHYKQQKVNSAPSASKKAE
jgi:lysophospholipase L1-like esterase